MPILVPVATIFGILSVLPPVFLPVPSKGRGRIRGHHFVAHSVINNYFCVNSSFMFSSFPYLISKAQEV